MLDKIQCWGRGLLGLLSAPFRWIRQIIIPKMEFSSIPDRVTKAKIPQSYQISKTATDWVYLAMLNEQLQDKEIALCNNRMIWMAAFQSILVTAFYAIISNKLHSTSVEILLFFIPLVGMLTSILAFLGIRAALIVELHLENERSFYQAVLGQIFNVDIPDLGSQRKDLLSKTSGYGFLMSLVVPFCFPALWLVICLDRYEIAIEVFKKFIQWITALW